MSSADTLERNPSQGMSPEAERLHMFLRFSAPFGPIGTALVVGFWWFWGLHLLWILVVACVVYWWLVFRGLRLVRADQLQAAVLCYAGGTLALSLGVGVLLPYAYALTTIVALPARRHRRHLREPRDVASSHSALHPDRGHRRLLHLDRSSLSTR